MNNGHGTIALTVKEGTVPQVNKPGQPERQTNRRFHVSVVTPAYNEADNLPLLYGRVSTAFNSLDVDWEWIVVDDHSTDDTFTTIADIAMRDSHVRAIRFARNFGSHKAISCGLDHAPGDCAIVLAADLQDPPETIPTLLAKWREGAQVVWAARAGREGEKATTVGLARLYYLLMRRVVGLKEIPSMGADFFLIDRCVIDALRQFNESNASILALITWMGFRQTTITYDKRARKHGRSGWTLEKKLKLALDSITSFTYLPIRLMSYVGILVAMLGFLYAAVVIINALAGHPVQGWASLMVVLLVIGGIQMLMMGVLGEYVWRALDEARQRPRYLIEATTEMNLDRHVAIGQLKHGSAQRGNLKPLNEMETTRLQNR
jgi:glycosyltransferase involved in cell wall biosynthesis